MMNFFPIIPKAILCSALCFIFQTLALGSEEKPNVLLICIDDLRPDLGCYGADYMHTPNIDALAKKGRLFGKHYVQAPTCGASRAAMLTGQYEVIGAGRKTNQGLFERAKKIKEQPKSVTPSLPAWFRQHGYKTVSVGKVSHHPGGMHGEKWDDPEQLEMPYSWDKVLMPTGAWLTPNGAMHGLANGKCVVNKKEQDVYESHDGPDTAYPDGLVAQVAHEELKQLAKKKKPFFLAVGYIKPHLPFGAPAKYMESYSNITFPTTPHSEKPQGRTTWHKSSEFYTYNLWNKNPNEDPTFAIELRKNYAACVSYTDSLVGELLTQLETLKLNDNTIIVLWSDHGWHLGEHGVWGKHTLFEESLRSPMIISYPGISSPGKGTEALSETIDIYPTLCELAQLPRPADIHGVSLIEPLKAPDAQNRPAVSYWHKSATIRTQTHRLIVHQDGYSELYDHTSTEKETKNIAESQPELVKQLTRQLKKRLPAHLK